MKFDIIPCVGLVLSLSGCIAALPAVVGAGEMGGVFGGAHAMKVSAAKGNMARATALAMGNNVNPDSIKISDPHVGGHESRWVADTPRGQYECSDDSVAQGPAYCAKHKDHP